MQSLLMSEAVPAGKQTVPVGKQTVPVREQTLGEQTLLSAQELLAGSLLAHELRVPAAVLRPGGAGQSGAGQDGHVRIRPLKVATLALVSRAAKEDPSLVPLLIIKDCLVEPALPMEQIRQMHIGLVHFLVSSINRISGLEVADTQLRGPAIDAHVLLARHFGWTPAQVAELTPGQVALYLAGVERLLALEAERKAAP